MLFSKKDKKLKVIIDTNVYDYIALEEVELVEKITNKLKIYNFSVIKKELENTPKDKLFENGGEIRELLLGVYGEIVSGKLIILDKNITNLANDYFNEYIKKNGKKSKKNLMNDFKIVACASLLGLDIVVSNDDKTMKNKICKKAYKSINLNNQLRTPQFIDFKFLKNNLL